MDIGGVGVGGGGFFPRMCVSLSPSVSTYVTDVPPEISGDLMSSGESEMKSPEAMTSGDSISGSDDLR